jgi:hypothetical protein
MSIGDENKATNVSSSSSSPTRITKQFSPRLAKPLKNIPPFFLKFQIGILSPAIGISMNGKPMNYPKNISFDKTVSVVLIPSRSEYQEAQLNSLLWYSASELLLIQKDALVGLSFGHE